MACANGVSALTLPWTNVSVQASSNVLVRGIEFGVGTPAQSLSLWPSFFANNTWVPNSLDCNDELSNLSCIAIDGGIYYISNSSTYKPASQQSWNGTRTQNGVNTYINDVAHVASNAVIWGMPLIQQVVNYDFRNSLGLGSDSSFLKSLVSQNLAPSRNFGIWSGSQSINDPIDGSLIVGGFDTSKVGSLTNFSSITGCLACAVVTGLDLTSSSGSTVALLNETFPRFNIAIDPYYAVGNVSVLAVPDEVRDVLVAKTQSVFLDDYGVYGWPSGQQPGDLKVTFSNGYQVTIPGNELWLPPREVNSEGQSTIKNNSEILNVLRATGPFEPTYNYPWGQPFLSTNYMVVWPDDGLWSLSPISSTQKTASSSVSNLCGDAVPSSPSPTTSGPSSTGKPSSGSHAGAIAGGVVGGVLALIALLAAFWFLRRRSKRRIDDRSSSRTELQSTNTGYQQNVGTDAYRDEASPLPKKSWVDYSGSGGTQVMPELAANDDPRHTIAEMPGSQTRAELPDNSLRR